MARPVLIMLALAVVVSCGETEDRPSRSDWSRGWAALEQQVPDPDSIIDAEDPATTCDEALAAVREARGRGLEPTPDGQIDAAYESWTEAAEAYLFDCPVDDADMLDQLADDTAEAAAEVDRLLAA